MSALARPLTLASLLTGAALSLHPVARLLPGHAVLGAALPTLAALALASRAAASRDGRALAWTLALGALAALGGLAADGVAGHHGALLVGVGQVATSFEETGRGGARLGLRPLGFAVAGESVAAEGDVGLLLPGGNEPVFVSRGRALRIEGYRLAQPERLEPAAARLQVHHEPAAPVVLTGALLLALGSLGLVPRRPWPAEAPHAPLLLAGAAFVLSLAAANGGSVLGWGYAVATPLGRVALPGVGVALGVALLAGLLGTLLLAAGRSSPAAAWAARPARLALWLGVALASVGLAGVLARLALASGALGLPLGPLALVAAAGFLAATLAATGAHARLVPRALPFLWPAAVAAAFVLALVASLAGLVRDGTYATPVASAAASAALVGVAALERTPLAGALRAAFVLALVTLPLV